jgi:hypothetical protein
MYFIVLSILPTCISGDFLFKSNVRLNAAQQAVTCIPDVRTVSLYLAVVVSINLFPWVCSNGHCLSFARRP